MLAYMIAGSSVAAPKRVNSTSVSWEKIASTASASTMKKTVAASGVR